MTDELKKHLIIKEAVLSLRHYAAYVDETMTGLRSMRVSCKTPAGDELVELCLEYSKVVTICKRSTNEFGKGPGKAMVTTSKQVFHEVQAKVYGEDDVEYRHVVYAPDRTDIGVLFSSGWSPDEDNGWVEVCRQVREARWINYSAMRRHKILTPVEQWYADYVLQ